MQIESNDCKENRFYLLMEHDVAVCICNGGGFLSCESKFVSLLPHSVDLNGTRHQYSCVRLCMNTTFFFRYFVGDAQADVTVGRQSNSYNKTSTWFGSQSVVMRCICKTLNINLCLTIRAHSFNSIRSLDKSDDFLSYKSSELWMVHTFISIDGDTMFAVRINSTQNSSCVVLANESMLE